MTTLTIAVFQIIINLIILICFFYLCHNVSKIHSQLEDNKNNYDDKLYLYYKCIAYGDKKNAKEYLQDFIWIKMMDLPNICIKQASGTGNPPGTIPKEYDKIKNAYKSLFEDVSASFPDLEYVEKGIRNLKKSKSI